MTDSGSNNDDGENAGAGLPPQVKLYGAAAAVTAMLGGLQMAFGLPGWSFSFLLALVFGISTLAAWLKSRA
tara:strand:+ start:3144 stop:3356 length:213 start_codon:yes stop_codon:yes gene_type:complete